ncbi:MAG: hypothetical protein WB902_32865, partial [Acetobacteraceae bacterium]
TWYLDVLWHNGRRQQMGNYKTALDAEDFIKIQLQAWHDGQKFHGNRLLATAAYDLVGPPRAMRDFG